MFPALDLCVMRLLPSWMKLNVSGNFSGRGEEHADHGKKGGLMFHRFKSSCTSHL